MTPEEAVVEFYAVIEAAIQNVLLDATAILASAGVRMEWLNVQASLTMPRPKMAVKDEDFLRKLRITPDLEVRE